MFSRNKPASIAPGFPLSTKVLVKKIKGGGFMLLNGTNAFNIPAIASFTTISVKTEEGGVGALVGADGKGQEATLASFGNVAIAGDAHAALIKAHSGLSEAGWGWFGKTALTLAGLWILLNLFSAPSSASMPLAAAQAQSEQSNIPQLDESRAEVAQALGSNRSLDDLANGGYQFAPQVQMPEIKAPQLNCEPS